MSIFIVSDSGFPTSTQFLKIVLTNNTYPSRAYWTHTMPVFLNKGTKQLYPYISYCLGLADSKSIAKVDIGIQTTRRIPLKNYWTKHLKSAGVSVDFSYL